MNMLVHKVPVSPHMSPDEQERIIRRYADGIKKTFPYYDHIFLPDDGTGRGSVTLLDSKPSAIRLKIARRKAWKRKHDSLCIRRRDAGCVYALHPR
jgi:hypothetical protein